MKRNRNVGNQTYRDSVQEERLTSHANLSQVATVNVVYDYCRVLIDRTFINYTEGNNDLLASARRSIKGAIDKTTLIATYRSSSRIVRHETSSRSKRLDSTIGSVIRFGKKKKHLHRSLICIVEKSEVSETQF